MMAAAPHDLIDGQVSSGLTATQVNGGTEPRPLRVLIAGAGIGGLSAGLALRKQGHHVEIFERSQFAQELGAAVHLCPNSNGILRRLGIVAEDFGANKMQQFSEYTSSAKHIRTVPVIADIWQHSWVLAHRVRLHEALKLAATDPEGEGPSVILHTASRVESIDTENARLQTKDGKWHDGDVIVGADGVHSITRQYIPGPKIIPFGSGRSAFRFMINRCVAEEDPETAKYFKSKGELLMFYDVDRRIVIYPTNDNEELNMVCMHPQEETDAAGDWNNTTSIEKMLEVYKKFDPSVLALLRKADPTTLKLWNLLDMDAMPTFAHQRLAMIGDAAHPFLPDQAQGAGMALEDGASLSVMLQKGVTAVDVPERLKLYSQARYERVNKIQAFTRLVGSNKNENTEKIKVEDYMLYNFCHDEFDHSSQVFREWVWNRSTTYWRQPIAFGPMPGPRQTHYGVMRNGDESTFTTATITFKTSRTLLQNLFPPGRKGYSFTSPGSIAFASFSQTTLNKMEWLGGSGYNFLGLFIHGVTYTKASGEVLKGAYLPILFENLTDPIVSGREELSMPKLYSAIDVYRRDTSYHINTSWLGAYWGSFTLNGLREVDATQHTGSVTGIAEDGTHSYRYMPMIGAAHRGKAAEEYPVFVHSKEEKPAPILERVLVADKASFKIDGLDWTALPTLHHIIERLAEVPVYEIMSAKVVEGRGVSDVGSARRIE